jgi:dipeptidyl aminopeptidase/acylaminoacyl peptidase
MRFYFNVLVFLSLVLIFTGCTRDNTPPIIDREVFFGDPEISGGRISPDGKYLSFLKPYNGTRNLWVKPLNESFDKALPITEETLRPIRSYFWSPDGNYILFIQDNAGDENFNIYAINPADAQQGKIPILRNLTNLKDVRVQIYHISKVDSDIMFIGINDRDRAWHDLYSLKISTGELKLVRENTSRYTGWLFDNNDNLRVAQRSRKDGTNEIWRVDSKGESLLFTSTMFEMAYPMAFSSDNQHFYLVSNVGDDVDLSQLYKMDVLTGNITHIEGDPDGKADFGRLVLSEKTNEILYTTYTDAYTRRYFKDADFESHFRIVQKYFEGKEVNLYGATKDENLWLVSVWSDTNPSSIYIYNKKSGSLTYQYNPRSSLPTQYLSEMKSISYQSSDGLEIQAYLTLPKGFKTKNLPLVVMPHGGPWSRDRWGYNSYTQFLANRGYAVLQPNFRASTGFGKSFLNAGNGQWGDLMQDDITWGVRHLIDQGIIDKDRVGIFGISYGGYATLAGLAFTPDLYACGISFVGPSNLITLLNSIPPYWESVRTTFHVRMGNPTTEEGLEQITRQSPLFSADKISAPLMVVQGQNDPRVKKAESDQIVVALRDRGFPIEYLNAPDEGHGFARPINKMAFVSAMEKFLAKHLGGRYQKEIPEEVLQRLNEITVDVDSVSLSH